MLIDACAIINLNNCTLLPAVAQLPQNLIVSPVVLSECGVECGATIIAMEAQGLVQFVDEADQDVDRFLNLLRQHNIGNGELESIAICEKLRLPFCTDDRAARRLAEHLLGPTMVSGSLRMLRSAVAHQIIKCDAAFAGYGEMLVAGAYLPDLVH